LGDKDGVLQVVIGDQLVTAQVVGRETLLSVADTATVVETNCLFGKGRRPQSVTIVDWIQRGLLKGIKISGRGAGGQWRVFSTSIDTFKAPRRGGDRRKE